MSAALLASTLGAGFIFTILFAPFGASYKSPIGDTDLLNDGGIDGQRDIIDAAAVDAEALALALARLADDGCPLDREAEHD